MDIHTRVEGFLWTACQPLPLKNPWLLASTTIIIADQGRAINSSIGQKDNGFQSPLQVWPDKKYALNNVTSIDISLYFWNNTNAIMNRSFYAPLFSFFAHQTSPNPCLMRPLGTDHSQYAYTTLIDAILHMDRIDKYTSLANGFCIQPRQQKWECRYLDDFIHNELYYVPCMGTTITLMLGSKTIHPGQKAFTIHYLDPSQILDAEHCHSRHSWFVRYGLSSVVKDNTTLSLIPRIHNTHSQS